MNIISDYEQLVEHLFKRLTKEDMARALADVAFGRPIAWPGPDVIRLTDSSVPRRGRPSTEELTSKANVMWGVLQDLHPLPITLEDLACASGLSVTTVKRIREGHYPSILEQCPGYYFQYFMQRPSRRQTPITERLVGPWRATLDLHGYHLAKRFGPVPDLFTTHALFWNCKGVHWASEAGRLDALNRYEMRRVRTLAEMIHASKGWALPKDTGIRPVPSHDAEECPPLLTYHASPNAPFTLHSFVKATGTPEEWWDLPDDVSLPGQGAQALLSWAIDFLKENEP